MKVRKIDVDRGVSFGTGALTFIAGPCVIESRKMALDLAQRLLFDAAGLAELLAGHAILIGASQGTEDVAHDLAESQLLLGIYADWDGLGLFFRRWIKVGRKRFDRSSVFALPILFVFFRHNDFLSAGNPFPSNTYYISLGRIWQSLFLCWSNDWFGGRIDRTMIPER